MDELEGFPVVMQDLAAQVLAVGRLKHNIEIKPVN